MWSTSNPNLICLLRGGASCWLLHTLFAAFFSSYLSIETIKELGSGRRQHVIPQSHQDSFLHCNLINEHMCQCPVCWQSVRKSAWTVKYGRLCKRSSLSSNRGMVSHHSKYKIWSFLAQSFACVFRSESHWVYVGICATFRIFESGETLRCGDSLGEGMMAKLC